MKTIYDIPNFKHRCTGCGACYQICPYNSISMTEDKQGFLTPNINSALCVTCGLCFKICPLQRSFKKNNSVKTYAIQAKDKNIRVSSSSGGFFYILAKNMIENKGVVIGAAFNSDYNVYHCVCKTMQELQYICGSKYVQSDLNNTYAKTKHYLQHGIRVLFSGTLCQIAGLKTYLGKEYNNLITCAVRCYGVPSPLIWKEYLKYRISKASNSKINEINFRYKYPSWQEYSIRIDFNVKSENYCKLFYDDEYMKLFLKRLSLRECCLNCEFNQHMNQEISNFIIGDFWEVDNELIGWNDGIGTSIVKVMTDVGMTEFSKISNNLRVQELVQGVKSCRNRNSLFLFMKRKYLFSEIGKIPFDIIVQKVIKRSILEKIYDKIRTPH